MTSAEAPAPVNLAIAQQEFNGLAFDPSFESWKPLNFTDRGGLFGDSLCNVIQNQNT
jgi:hypothetical protein